MKLPNREQAVVEEVKIVEYLLSSIHPAGRDKAAFFGRFGFRAEAWQLLAEALLAHATDHEVAATRDSPYGTRYAVEGELTTPHGQRPLVRSVWVVEAGTGFPRLVSAYPLKERKG